jgi:small subunit ribosomal protein S8
MINSLSIDFLIRVKNGYMAGRKTITAPVSKFNLAIADLLKKNHLINDYSVEGDIKKTATISLSYENNLPKVNGMEIFSKPGRRIYEKAFSLPWGKTKQSLIIISTSAGLMSQKEAKSKGLGGEIIAEIY